MAKKKKSIVTPGSVAKALAMMGASAMGSQPGGAQTAAFLSAQGAQQSAEDLIANEYRAMAEAEAERQRREAERKAKLGMALGIAGTLIGAPLGAAAGSAIGSAAGAGSGIFGGVASGSLGATTGANIGGALGGAAGRAIGRGDASELLSAVPAIAGAGLNLATVGAGSATPVPVSTSSETIPGTTIPTFTSRETVPGTGGGGIASSLKNVLQTPGVSTALNDVGSLFSSRRNTFPTINVPVPVGARSQDVAAVQGGIQQRQAAEAQAANEAERMGMERQRIGMEQQRVGLEERRVGLEQQRVGISQQEADTAAAAQQATAAYQKKTAGLQEKQFGLEEQKLGPQLDLLKQQIKESAAQTGKAQADLLKPQEIGGRLYQYDKTTKGFRDLGISPATAAQIEAATASAANAMSSKAYHDLMTEQLKTGTSQEALKSQRDDLFKRVNAAHERGTQIAISQSKPVVGPDGTVRDTGVETMPVNLVSAQAQSIARLDLLSQQGAVFWEKGDPMPPAGTLVVRGEVMEEKGVPTSFTAYQVAQVQMTPNGTLFFGTPPGSIPGASGGPFRVWGRPQGVITGPAPAMPTPQQ